MLQGVSPMCVVCTLWLSLSLFFLQSSCLQRLPLPVVGSKVCRRKPISTAVWTEVLKNTWIRMCGVAGFALVSWGEGVLGASKLGKECWCGTCDYTWLLFMLDDGGGNGACQFLCSWRGFPIYRLFFVIYRDSAYVEDLWSHNQPISFKPLYLS